MGEMENLLPVDQLNTNLMLTAIHPKLPMRDKSITRSYYLSQLGFTDLGKVEYPGYLKLGKDQIEIHFFEHKTLIPEENDGQVYIRVKDINTLYQTLQQKGVSIHPNDPLQEKPWGQREFSLLDPDNNLLTFGESI
jgi:catechol 2,3-dioxygenase-like lactoylglutathione lyase family enzyme